MTLIDFYNQYFLVNLKDYSNLKIDLEINKILLYFVIGIIITMIIFNYRTAGNIKLVKKLLRYEANNEENSKTLDELQLNTFNSRLSLSGNGRIKKIIKRVGEVELTYEEYVQRMKSKDCKPEKIDFTTAKFYIPEESLNEANNLAESKSSSLLSTILLILLLISIYVLLLFFMPSILTLLNNIVG